MAVLKHRAAIWTNVGAALLLGAAALVIVNVLAARSDLAWDWTATKQFTLHSATERALEALPADQPVRVVAFLLRDQMPLRRYGIRQPDDSFNAEVDTKARNMLALYRAASRGRLQLDVVDPVEEPRRTETLKRELNIRLSPEDFNVVVFRYRDAEERVTFQEMATPNWMGQDLHLGDFIGEAALTTALIKVTRSGTPREALWLGGHGETVPPEHPPGPEEQGEEPRADGFDELRKFISQEAGLRVRDAMLQALPEIPSSTQLVVIANPQEPYLEGEVALLQAYLEKGGRLLILLNPIFPSQGGPIPTLGLNPLLEPWGARILAGRLHEHPRFRFGQEGGYPWEFGTIDYSPVHPITERLSHAARQGQMLPVHVRDALGLEVVTEGRAAGISPPVGLVGSSRGSLLKIDWANPEPNPSVDREGPHPIAIACEKVIREVPRTPSEGSEPPAGETEDPQLQESVKTRILVIGDADMATNFSLERIQANATMTVGGVQWLLEQESRIGIRPARKESVQINISDEQYGRLGWTLLAYIPGSGVLLGLVMWWIRRGD